MEHDENTRAKEESGEMCKGGFAALVCGLLVFEDTYCIHIYIYTHLHKYVYIYIHTHPYI